MDLHLYDETDIRNPDEPIVISSKTYPFQFIADVPGDNPDVLGDYDNHMLAERLKSFGAIGDFDRLDCEMCCFYIYFKTKVSGLAFIKKLNAYLSQKSRLVREAESF